MIIPLAAKIETEVSPILGRVMIRLPKKAEKSKSGLYMDTTYADGSLDGTEKEYQQEAAIIAKNVIQSKDGQYMIKWGQQEKLKRIVRAEVRRLRQAKADLVNGVDRWNPVHAEVVAVSEGLDCVQVGDIVYFGYLAIANLRDDKHIYYEEVVGEPPVEYGFIDIKKCYCRVRNGEIQALNDFVLVSPIPITQKVGMSDVVVHKSGLMTVEKETKFDTQRGVVASAHEGSEVKSGDMVFFEKGCDSVMEYEVIQTLPNPYFCLRESEILCKIEA